MKTRRRFLKQTGGLIAALPLLTALPIGCSSGSRSSAVSEQAENTASELFFKISLAEWSLNRSLFAGKMTNMDFPAKAKSLGIDAVEYVNQFFKDQAKDTAYLSELKTRCDDLGVKSVLIMIDGEGGLAHTTDAQRLQAVENHYKWVEAAKALGCHSIRVNAYGKGEKEAVLAAAVDGLGRLSTFAKDYDLGVIVENHGGFSSMGDWLAAVMRQVNMPNCGTLPDFGNFCINSERTQTEGGEEQWRCLEEYDRYKGIEELMPFAKGVSAKSHSFDQNGEEETINYQRALQLVKNAGYTGHIGIEFEGRGDEDEGILATKNLLEKAGRLVS